LGKERKEQIVRAAAKRFARHGMGKTTLDEIARDLRIGKATIYHYFPSKEDLFYDTIDWETKQYLEDIKVILNNQEIPMGTRLLEYFSYKETVYQKYKLLYELMLQLFRDDSFEKEKNILQSFLESERQIVRSVIGSAQEGKSIDPFLPFYIAHTSWGLMFGNRLNQISNQEKTDWMKELMFKSLKSLLFI